MSEYINEWAKILAKKNKDREIIKKERLTKTKA